MLIRGDTTAPFKSEQKKNYFLDWSCIKPICDFYTLRIYGVKRFFTGKRMLITMLTIVSSNHRGLYGNDQFFPTKEKDKTKEEVEDDIFTASPVIKSKWNTDDPAPSLGSKWESSKWETGEQSQRNRQLEVCSFAMLLTPNKPRF